jgi:hypothetical protein
MRYLHLILLLALVLITSGCVTPNHEVTPTQIITIVPTPIPTATPEPIVTRPMTGIDPIIGAWDNGMVFDADGSVGGDKNVTWKANDMLQYSYFVTVESRAVKDIKGGRSVDPTAISTEWIYNPYSDTIHIRDSTAGVRRVLLLTVTAAPARP